MMANKRCGRDCQGPGWSFTQMCKNTISGLLFLGQIEQYILNIDNVFNALMFLSCCESLVGFLTAVKVLSSCGGCNNCLFFAGLPVSSSVAQARQL